MSGDTDKTIRIWKLKASDIQTRTENNYKIEQDCWIPEIEHEYKSIIGDREINCLIQLDHERLVSGNSDGTITIWNVVSKLFETWDNESWESQNPEEQFNSETIDDDAINTLIKLTDRQLVSMSKNGKIKIWNVSLKCVTIFSNESFYLHRSLIKLSEKKLLTKGSYHTTELWEAPSSSFKVFADELKEHTDQGKNVMSHCWEIYRKKLG